MELQQYLTMLRDRWVPALVAAILVLGATVTFTFLQTPDYQATNRVFVQTQSGSDVADLNSGVNFASQQITSYADVATTPLVLEPVIEQLGLNMTAQELSSRISTNVPPDTLILEITATDQDPARAASIANATSESLQAEVTTLGNTGDQATVELTVITPAVEPSEPASPNIPRNIALGLVLAAFAAATIAILRELTDNRVRRPEDIEKLYDRPVIAAIPASRDPQGLPQITAQQPQSLQAEAYRSLRTNLQFMGLTGDKRSVLLTSSLPGEGKTSSAVNLAHVVAEAGSRVLLIDADLRRPSIATYLGLESGAGLTTVLSRRADLRDVTQPLEAEGLEVLASGPIPPNPSELLGSAEMRSLLEHALTSYDFLVIDTAPLLAVTDAVVLSHNVGGTIVVAQSERVRRPQLKQALEKLDTVQARILGLILNRVQGRSQGAYSYNYTYISEESPKVSRPTREIAEISRTQNSTQDSERLHHEPPQKDPLPTRKLAQFRDRRGRRAATPPSFDAAPKPWPGATVKHSEPE